MSRQEQIFHIAGSSFSKLELESICLEKISVIGTPAWERDIWNFIREWISPSKTIRVQTSGSTGRPKTIEISKKHMVASAKATLDFLDLKKGDTALLCLPVKFIAGKMMVVRAFVGGLRLFFVEPTSIPNLTKFDDISFAAMVPLQVVGLLESDEGIKLINAIQKLLVGGSFLPPELNKKLKSVKSEVWQTYGMTETITHIALRRLNGEEASKWYKPIRGVEINIDSRQCLEIHAPYIGVDRLTTNDIAELKKGKFRILGRVDHLVISGGIKLHPERIERKLTGLTSRRFFIAGKTDEKLGEKLVLCIEDDGNLNRQVYHLWNFVERKLTGYEIPKEIIFIPEFIRTENGKINRKLTIKSSDHYYYS